ncbi:MAG: alpha/beta hydrolase [Clostridia bacterium]|nr:alpha/beta hydrolase [Clostridia bacterium]
MSKNHKEKMKKPFYKRIWLWIAVALILLVSIPALTMPFSYNVQKVLIRVICEPRFVPTPDNYDAILANTAMLSDVNYNSAYSSGYMDIISPKDNTDILPLLVYFHGGYYVGGDKSGKEPYCRIIANDGYVVANVNYVLAPDEIYPAQAIQANEAISFLVDNADTYNIDINKIFIGGDSAGAHLSGYMGAFYTNAELQQASGIDTNISAAQIKGVILLCGFYNMMTVRETRFPLLADAMWMLTGEKKFEQYERVAELNTIANITDNYPNTYLLCGDKDPFYAQNWEMKAELESKGVNVTSYLPQSTDKNLGHEFQERYNLPEATVAMNMLLEFLAQYS